MAILRADEVRAMKRGTRNPEHSWHLRYRPHVVQPHMIAPVLPGETLKHALFQTRTVSDPIKNPLIGWWNEHWLFYVKLTDLYDRDKVKAMLLNPEEDMTSLDSATNLDNYHENTSSGTDIDWVKLCMEVIVDNYFRSEGETFNTSGTTITSVASNTVPLAEFKNGNFSDSFINDADFITPANETLTDVGSEAGAAVTIAEINNAMLRWEIMRESGLTQQTFEEYCASYYGGTAAPVDDHKPELLRYSVDWTYPTNTIDPTNGTPRSAVSWAKKWSADKARLFREPGFLFSVTTTRPKVYFSGLSSNAVMLMKSAQSWLPPSLMKDPYASMVKVAAGDAPITLNTDAYWVDINDILQHGDQFVNFALTATDANIMDNPTAGGTDIGRRFPSSTNLDELFVAASPANQIREDGIAKLSIASRRHEDTSPNMVGNNLTVG